MASTITLPAKHRALVQTSRDSPMTVQEVPTPEVTPGSVVICVLSAQALPYARSAYYGDRGAEMPLPAIPGPGAIGRVVAVGSDATKLKPGQLVFADLFIRGRDNASAQILLGLADGFNEQSKQLMRDHWRHGTFAEYARFPLENVHVLDEARLLGPPTEGGLGYTVEQLCAMVMMLAPFGGLRDVGVQPGDTVLVTPATASFGGLAVFLARAMGARVIAMGRNMVELKRLKSIDEEVELVQMTGNLEAELAALSKFGPVDVWFDISPNEAKDSTHFKSGLISLRQGGRASFMGGIQGDIPLPLGLIMGNNLQIRGRFMYERHDVVQLIKMVERGTLRLDEKHGFKVNGTYGLEDWDAAFDNAASNSSAGLTTHFKP